MTRTGEGRRSAAVRARRAVSTAVFVAAVLGSAAGCSVAVDSTGVRAPGAVPTSGTGIDQGPQQTPDPTATGATTPGTPDPTATGPTTPGSTGAGEFPERPAPDLPVPEGAETFTGDSGWEMDVSPEWTKFDIPDFAEEAAWRLPGGKPAGSTTVNVLVEKPMMMLPLDQYLSLSISNLRRDHGQDVISDVAVYRDGDREYARIAYTAEFDGDPLAAVAYVIEVPDGWVVATLGAHPDVMPGAEAAADPYLATLRPAG